MYSGMQPPECDLTQQQIEHISELVSRLDTPHTGGPLWHGTAVLSTDSYSVWWLDERPIDEAMFTKPFEGSWMMVRVRVGGPVHVYRQEENFQGVYLKDTVGLWEYLATIGSPLLAKHFRDVNESMEDYYEKVLGIPYEKKV